MSIRLACNSDGIPNRCLGHHPELLFLSFNQDYSRFVCGMQNGFKVFDTCPLKQVFERTFQRSAATTTGDATTATTTETTGAGNNRCGISLIEPLFRCNLLALTGGGQYPYDSDKKVLIWDDYQSKHIAELEFREPIRSVRLTSCEVVVVLETRIYLYNFTDLTFLHRIETDRNPKGLCAVYCPKQRGQGCTQSVLACPAAVPGRVHVERYATKETVLIDAHRSALSQLSLNSDGTLLATSSTKGTLIKIFDTHSGQALKTLRRGVDQVEIFSIAFHPHSTYLCVSSDKGTVHIYNTGQRRVPTTTTTTTNGTNKSDSVGGSSSSPTTADTQTPSIMTGLKVKEDVDPLYDNKDTSMSRPVRASENNEQVEPKAENPKSSFSFMTGWVPGYGDYFGSEWSFSQFRVFQSKVLCAFGQEENTVIAIGTDGRYFKFRFDPQKGGEAVQEDFRHFLSETNA